MLNAFWIQEVLIVEYSRELYELADVELEKRRAENARQLAERKQEIYARVLGLKAIDGKILDLRLAIMKKKFKGTAKHEAEIDKLISERKAILRTNKLSDLDFEVQYYCPLCRDTGVSGYKICGCKMDIVRRAAVKRADASSDFWQSFDDFSLDYYPSDVGKRGKTKRQIAELILNAAKKFESGNALIFGAVGVGKTFLSECIANKWASAGKTVCYYSATRLFLMLNEQYFNKDKVRDLSDKVSLLYEADLLIIDDLGTEFRNSFTESMFFDILNSRLRDRKSMVISTNLAQHDIAGIYSDRIYSRIRGNFQVWELLGDDIRELKLRG